MHLPLDLAAYLRATSTHDGDPGELARDLDELLARAVRAVPSCLGVSLALNWAGLPLAVTRLTMASALHPVRGSLELRLPTKQENRRSGLSGAVLHLYGSVAGAFDRTAAGLRELLDLDPRRVTVDQHLRLPDPETAEQLQARQLDDLSAVERAVGVLLDSGLLPEQGRAELVRRAHRDKITLPAAARVLVSDLLAGRIPPQPGHPEE